MIIKDHQFYKKRIHNIQNIINIYLNFFKDPTKNLLKSILLGLLPEAYAPFDPIVDIMIREIIDIRLKNRNNIELK